MIVGVVGNRDYAGLRRLLAHLHAAASTHELHFQTEADLAEFWPAPVAALDLDDARADVLLCFGGDGTMLRTARLVGQREIPILGVKIGRVGFLADITPDQLDTALAALAAGDYRVEHRKTLEAYVVADNGQKTSKVPVLNDVVIHKAGVARLIRLRVMVGEEEIGAFASDGLIVATPTGSTAYSLSAGGPIMVPGVDALVVTPICPHTMAVRPLVVPGDATVTIDVLPPWGDNQEVNVSYDGQLGHALSTEHRVVVTRARHEARLIRIGREGFFTLMRRKLQWGDLSDRERE